MFNTNATKELTALFNNVSIGIVTIDEQGEIVMSNHFATKQFGYAEGELTGKK